MKRDREKRRALEAAETDKREAEQDLAILRELRALGASKGPHVFASLKHIRAEARIAELRGETVSYPRLVADFLRRTALPAVKRPPREEPKKTEADVEQEKAAYHARLVELGIRPH